MALFKILENGAIKVKHLVTDFMFQVLSFMFALNNITKLPIYEIINFLKKNENIFALVSKTVNSHTEKCLSASVCLFRH